MVTGPPSESVVALAGAIHGAMSPVPLAAKPLLGFTLVQDQTAPSTSGKSTPANSSPGQRIWSGNGPTDGKPGNTVTITSAGTLGQVVGCKASMV